MARFRENFPLLRLESCLSVIGIALLLCLVASPGCTQPVVPYPAPVATTQAPPPATAATVAMQTPTSQATQAASDYLTYTNAQYGFTMSYPAGWSMQENTGGSVVVFTAPSTGMGAIPTSMRVTVEDLSAAPMSLDQYRAAQLAKTKGLDNFNLIYDQAYKGSDFIGWKIAYTATQVTLMEWVEVYALRGTSAYTLTYSSRADTYAGYVIQMDNMFKSFQLIG